MDRAASIGLVAGVATALGAGVLACAEASRPARPPGPREVVSGAVVVESPPGVARPPFEFSPEAAALLDDVQRGAFEYLWTRVVPGSGMVYDRSSATIVSVAGVGFQLAALPVGVERGWIGREEGEARARSILAALEAHPENRKEGLFYHYLEGDGAPSREGYEFVVSTVDSALLFAGMAVASSYFGGEVAERADRMMAQANWAYFAAGEEVDAWARGMVTLGWKPADAADPTGEGEPLPYHWVDAGDEHRLVTFLGVCVPDESKRLDPAVYYRLRRGLGEFDGRKMVWFPWSGALFTAFFAHCFIDYAGMGPDEPSRFVDRPRARVDWWENSRRHVLMHRARAIANPRGLPTLGENAWGLTASDCPEGYCVPGLYPAPLLMTDALPGVDYPPEQMRQRDNWGDGTVAPYGAGCAVMFEPAAAVAALRHYRELAGEDGRPLLWRPVAEGGCGFLDAFNLGGAGAGAAGEGSARRADGPWVASDYVAIDQGPLVLAIENARTGLIWRLFHEHPHVRGGMERLGLRRTTDRGGRGGNPE